MRLTLIAAIDADGAIGQTTGGLPWHLPDESTHFRAYCAGQWLLVGRRTVAEMDGWFQPDHRVIVLSRSSNPPMATTAAHGNLMAAATVADALALARSAGAPELVVIGGAHTYAQALPWADQLVLSRLALHSGGTIQFPPVNWSEWILHHTDPDRPDTTTGVAFRIEYWERRAKTTRSEPGRG